MSRHHNDRQLRPVLSDSPQHFKPAQLRHFDVEKHEAGHLFSDRLERRLSIRSRSNFVPHRLQSVTEKQADVSIIVHDKNGIAQKGLPSAKGSIILR